MTTRRDELRAELLEKYGDEGLHAFYQIDCWSGDGRGGDQVESCVTFGFGSAGTTPMVRVLIRPLAEVSDVTRLLKKTRRWLRNGGGYDPDRLEHDERCLDDELCPRCGSDMGGEHHPLCTNADGTPTGLTDDAVREALAILGKTEVDDIPF